VPRLHWLVASGIERFRHVVSRAALVCMYDDLLSKNSRIELMLEQQAKVMLGFVDAMRFLKLVPRPWSFLNGKLMAIDYLSELFFTMVTDIFFYKDHGRGILCAFIAAGEPTFSDASRTATASPL